MTSSLKNLILNEHNDRRFELYMKKLKRTTFRYQACRGSQSKVESRCPCPPFFTPLRRHKLVTEVPYSPADVPPLLWDSSLASRAQSYAEKLACIPGGCTSGSLPHDYSNGGYGENLKCNSGGRFRSQDKAEIERLVMDQIESWWSEFRIAGDKIGEYLRSMPDGEMNSKIGHFAQMAWAETTKVGCGVQRNGSKMILVCNYDPIGNYPGRPVVRDVGNQPRVEFQFNEQLDEVWYCDA